MAFPSYSSTTSNQFNDTPLRAPANAAAQLAYQESVLNGAASSPVNVTGVVLSYTGIAEASRLQSGSYDLDFLVATPTIAIGGGAPVDISGGDGTYTLTAPNGKQIKAVVTALSLPVADKTDEIVIHRGIGKEGKEIFWIQINDVVQFIQGTQFITGQTQQRISATVNVTGVVLTVDAIVGGSTPFDEPIAPTDQIEIGTHVLAFVFSGTLLSIGGGTGVDISLGGNFELTAPNGKTVFAVVAAASIPGSDKSDTVTVSQYMIASKVRTDNSLKYQQADIYRSI